MALASNYGFFFFFKRFNLVRGIPLGLTFGLSCFVSDCEVKILFCTESWTRTNSSTSSQFVYRANRNDFDWGANLNRRETVYSLLQNCFSCTDSKQFFVRKLVKEWHLMLYRIALNGFTTREQKNWGDLFEQGWKKWLSNLQESDGNIWKVLQFFVIVVHKL